LTKTRVLLITGPTAVGKTDSAVRTAEELGGEIISADSRQVFRRLDIGTAKPGPEILDRVPHHLIDILEPGEEYSAGRFVQDAVRIAGEIRARGNVPIVCGGATLYTKALREGLFDEPGDAGERRRVREELRARVRRDGVGPLFASLSEVDPETARRLVPTDTQRIVRALEVYQTTGTQLSRLQALARHRPDVSCLSYCLSLPRKELVQRIRARTRAMIERGLVDEVRRLLEDGFDRRSSALRSVGYAEIVAFLEGAGSLEEAERRINTNTWHYAKRQLTWFRGQENMTWLRKDGTAVETICNDWKSRQETTESDGATT
jgi:tRNA dimethylallyltransferase